MSDPTREALVAVDGGEPLDDDEMTARDDLRAYLAGAHAAGLPEKSCRSILELADAMVAPLDVKRWRRAFREANIAGCDRVLAEYTALEGAPHDPE